MRKNKYANNKKNKQKNTLLNYADSLWCTQTS